MACQLETGLTADCTELDVEEGNQQSGVHRPTFGGNLLAVIMCPDHHPQMSTVRPGVFKKAAPDESRTGEIVREDVHIAPPTSASSWWSGSRKVAEAVNLEEGRGHRGKRPRPEGREGL